MSEAEDACGRLWRQQSKLEGRLTQNGRKPKWMRARTFERFYERIDAVEEARDLTLRVAPRESFDVLA